MATIPPSLPISPQPSDSSWVKATPEAVTKGMDQKTYDAAKGKISPQESEHTKPANDYKSTPLPNSEDIDALMTELERLAKDDLPPEEQSQQPIGLPEETSQSPVSDVASKLRELDELAEQLGKPIGLPKETSQSPVSDVDPKLEKLDKQAEQMHQEEKKPSISSEELKKLSNEFLAETGRPLGGTSDIGAMNTLYKRPSADKASAENPPAAYSADKASKNPPAAYSADKASAKNPPAAYDDSALSFRNVDVEVSETSGKVTVRANKEPTFRERIADKLDKLYGKFPNLRDFSFKSLLTSIKTHATAIFRLFGSPGKEASAVNMRRGDFARPGDKTNFAPSVPEKNETYIFNFASFELSLKKELNADSAENIVKDIKSKEGREYIKSKKFLESDKSEQLTKKLIDYAVDTEGAAFFQGQKLPVTESIGTLIRLDPTYFNNVVKYLNDKPNLERYDRENPSYIQMKKELKNYLVNLGLSDKGKEIFEKLDQGQLKKLFTAEELKALFPSK